MLDDGTPLPESTVILAYLDEKFPATPLLPASPEGRALERLTAGLGRVERFLAPQGFDAGPAFGQADCVLGPALMGVAAFAGMLDAPDLLARRPKLAAYFGRVTAHPALARVLGELQAALAAGPLPAG